MDILYIWYSCNHKRTLKEKLYNFLQIINLPYYFFSLYFAIALSSIFNIFIKSKKFETIETISRIYFKNRVYIRSFVCNKFICTTQDILLCLYSFYDTFFV
jgi:hypothetical protein